MQSTHLDTSIDTSRIKRVQAKPKAGPFDDLQFGNRNMSYSNIPQIISKTNLNMITPSAGSNEKIIEEEFNDNMEAPYTSRS